MGNVAQLHLVLVIVFAFSLSGLAVELLYLLHCRRRRLQRPSLGLAADPEFQGDSGAENELSLSKWMTLHHALCFKKQPSSRIEPTFGAASPAAKPAAVAALAELETFEEAATEAEEDCDLTRWREMCLGPSRLLYTIHEEEDAELAVSGRHEEARRCDDDDCDGGDTPFYTPFSSPPRDPEQAGEIPPSGERRQGWPVAGQKAVQWSCVLCPDDSHGAPAWAKLYGRTDEVNVHL